MSSQQVDAPDGQNAVVSSQTLLGTFPNSSLVETVALPPNTETLLLFSVAGINMNVASVVGVTTGNAYSFSQLPTQSGYVQSGIYVVSVSPAADGSVVITWTGSGLGDWYVVADAGIRQVFDQAIAGALGAAGAGAPLSAVVVAGLASGDVAPLSVDGFGHIIPIVPNATVVVTLGASFGAVLNALGAGQHYYLFGYDVDATVAGKVRLIDSVNDISRCTVPVSSTGTVQLNGYETSGAVQANASAGTPTLLLRYAIGP